MESADGNGGMTPCKRCGSREPPEVIIGPHRGGHWAKQVCSACGAWQRWLPKPDSDPTKYRRPNKHRRPNKQRELAAKYSRGFCELCLRTEKHIPPPQTLEAHHVTPYKHGGGDERENIWIVCTECHKLIEWRRTYTGHVVAVAEQMQSHATS